MIMFDFAKYASIVDIYLQRLTNIMLVWYLLYPYSQSAKQHNVH